MRLFLPPLLFKTSAAVSFRAGAGKNSLSPQRRQAMSTWVWVVIAVAIVIALAVLVAEIVRRRRTGKLRGRFGPEYNRTVETADSRRQAEAELAAREERRQQFDIRPLTPEAERRYTDAWQVVQAQFVDDPRAAVGSAAGLIKSVMTDRGYPVEDFDQRAADLSVDHPDVVENYRQGHRLAARADTGDGATEDLREAMRHYRALFTALVDSSADEPTRRESDAVTAKEPPLGQRG
jgi:hypothetical protein